METINEKKVTRLPFWVKFGFGGSDGTNTAAFTIFYLFFLYFLTDVVRMSPATAGLVILVGTVWDAVLDPAVGVFTDGLKSKWGRRRPIILAIAVPFGVGLWLLFTDFHLSQGWTVAYFITASIFFKTVFALLYIPTTALSAEMTQDYDERTSLMSYRAFWSQLFCIFGASVPLILAGYFQELSGSQRIGWSAMAATLGFFGIFPILMTWRVSRGYELFPKDTRVNLKDVRDALFKNRPFRYIVGIWTFGALPINVVGAITIYFMTYYLGFNENESSLAFLFLFVCTVVWIPLISFMTKKLGKRLSWNLNMGVWALAMGVGMWFVSPDRIPLFYVMLFLASGGVAAVYLIGWAMMVDVVEVDEFKMGQRREGVYMGIISFVQKTSVALALWLVGMILSWIGYVPDIQQTDRALLGIRLIFTEGTAILICVGILICYLNPMTKAKHDALRMAIQQKKEGKPYDTSGFEDILR